MKRVLGTAVLFGALAAAGAQAPPKSAIIDSGQLLADLKVLSADDMQGREVGTPGGAKARASVVERFRASGIAPFGETYEQAFAFRNEQRGGAAERRGVNVVGYVAGRDRGAPQRYIVVSAHYDHVGVRGGMVFNGANDNASGTAALFALGKYFSTHPPAHPLIFAAFDAEEGGLRGSRAFVRNPPVEAAAIAVDLNMDMLGREERETLYVVGTRLQPFLAPFVARIAAAAPVKLIAGHEEAVGKSEDWTKDSDHYAFIEAKIPALYFGVEDFAHVHRPDDDFETITAGFYVRAVETIVLAVRDFDENLDALPVR
jgi:hypothetical protein